MKKIIITAMLVMGALASNATLLFYDDFSASAGNLSGTAPDVGDTWTEFVTSGTTPVQIEAGSLTAPAGFAASSGNKAKSAIGSGNESHAKFATQTIGSTVYYSLLINIPVLETSTGINLINLMYNDGADYASVRYARGASDSFFTLGLAYRGTTGIAMDTTQLAAGSTHLVVIGYQQNSGTLNDVASFWLDPDSSTFGAGSTPTPMLTLTGSSTDAGNINGLEIKNTSTMPTPTYFDELRVGTTWADVTPIPEPATIGMLGLGALVTLLIRWLRKY